tara:strand:- start:799 stop:1386 length:588 start_codon:yes stop_codon:yes gene_type:complete
MYKYKVTGEQTMKITQITSENVVNEAPGGNVLGNVARKVGAKVAGAVGAKGTAAGMQGKNDANAKAKELFTQYRGYMGQTGGNPKQPTVDQVSDFMKKQGLPTNRLKGLQGQLTPKQVDDILQNTAQDSFKGGDGQAAAGTEPGSPGDPNAPKPGAGGAGAPAGGQAGASGIPANIQKAIDSLDANGKKELAALL